MQQELTDTGKFLQNKSVGGIALARMELWAKCHRLPTSNEVVPLKPKTKRLQTTQKTDQTENSSMEQCVFLCKYIHKNLNPCCSRSMADKSNVVVITPSRICTREGVPGL